MHRTVRRTGLVVLIATLSLMAAMAAQEDRRIADAPRWRQHDVRRPKPPAIEPGDNAIANTPPKGAVILFDGSSLDAWKSGARGPAQWKVSDGYFEIVPGAGPIETKAKFGDIQLHIEWSAPDPPRGRSQDRGNSGVFLMGQFEVQVLDSYQAGTYADGQAGAIYGEYPPLFNASRPPGRWQSFDIAFRRPRFDAGGTLRDPAHITVFHNGILVQNNEEPFGPTSWLRWLPYTNESDRGPISLQDHNHPVRYRNVWVLELPERPSPTPQDVAPPKTVALEPEVLDQCAGRYALGSNPDAPIAKIVREDGHLTITFPFRPGALVMEPISETEFSMPHTDGHFTFRKDGSGHVTSVLFHIGDGERDMKRVGP
jgi:hypothetical protein